MVVSPENVGAKGVPFFIPAQNPPSGTAIPREDGTVPKIFQPLQIRGVKIPNRIWVSPMCQYSGKEGFQGPWHHVHYGALTARGPGFTMVEATAVSENGRITPECGGIWLDAHIEGLRKHVDFAHSQNAVIAIQLAHAGRKASCVAPWLGPYAANEEVGGWPKHVVGPDNQPFDITPEGRVDPHALTLAEIEQIKRDFVAGAKRAVRAGFDIIELHYAHGYLMSSFLSPASNSRTDQYGGSFENRVRLPLEVVEAVRAVLPETTPLFVRISATDWMKDSPGYKGGSWDVEQSAQLAKLLADRGVDVLDVSSGGVHRDQKVKGGPGYQTPFAKYIKKAVGNKLLVSAVGTIRTATLAEKIINGSTDPDDPALDLIAVGRSFQKNPALVWEWADELQVGVQVASQIGWGFGGRAKLVKTPELSMP